MQLQQIERVKTISAKDFYHNYYKKQIPVVIEELTHDWLAYQKWRLSYMREIKMFLCMMIVLFRTKINLIKPTEQ